MIRPIAALQRQVQEFFHRDLTGIFRWDEVKFKPLERRPKAAPPSSWERNSRGKRIRPDRPEGKFVNGLAMQFGQFDLRIAAPTEEPPQGWIQLTDSDTVIGGPLDASTWTRIAEHIKQIHEERKNVA